MPGAGSYYRVSSTAINHIDSGSDPDILSLFGAPSLSEIQERVRKFSSERPDLKWIQAARVELFDLWRWRLTKEQRPRRVDWGTSRFPCCLRRPHDLGE